MTMIILLPRAVKTGQLVVQVKLLIPVLSSIQGRVECLTSVYWIKGRVVVEWGGEGVEDWMDGGYRFVRS